MTRRFTFLTAAVAGVLAIALPASAMPRDTTIRTIRDTNGDNMLEYAPGENYTVVNGDPGFRPPRDGSILNFLQMSDFQILDEESPGRVEFLDTTQQQGPRPLGAAYRPQEALSTQLVEAMVRAARNTVSPLTSRQLQLAMLTGDNADSQQYNETRWFIDILDGHKKVDPNSGIPVPGCEATPGSLYDGVRGGGDLGYYDPDHSGEGTDGKGYSPVRTDNDSKGTGDVTVRDFPGLLEAAQQPFQAIGLDIPWYSAFGNHDALVQGNSPDAYEQSPLGPGNAPEPDAPENSNPAFQSIATGCYKPILPPPNAGQDPANFFGDLTSAVVVPPDPRRCYLAKDEADPTAPAPCDKAGWIEQHFLTTGTPVGHGFAPTATLDEASIEAGYGRPPVADANDDGYYSFSPTTGVRFVVLDTITDECGSLLCSEGTVDDPQFRWLESQLQTAVAMGQYVLVFSHHTERTTRWVSTDPTEFPIHYGQRVDQGDPMQPQNELSPSTLEDLFCAYPNVIAHIDGHEHVNAVRHHDCDQKLPNPLYPSAQKDYWEISTAAHIDWPQQTRMIELIDNHDGTMSLACTMLDHDGPANAGGPQKPDYAANGQAGEQVLKLAGIARELGYNDYQNDRGSAGTPADRNVIIVIDKPWPYAQ